MWFPIPQYFHIYDPPKELISLCNKYRDDINIKLRKRIQFQFLEKQGVDGHELFLRDENIAHIITAENVDCLSVFDLSLDTFKRVKIRYGTSGKYTEYAAAQLDKNSSG